MARKPRSELSPAYRRRIERAEARGKTRQQARGHKTKEHVIRKRREMSEAARTGKLTSPQRQKIKAFLREQEPRIGSGIHATSAEDLWDDYRDLFDAKGYAWFLHVRDERNRNVRDYKELGRLYGSVDAMLAAFGERDAEGWMLFYH